MTRYQLPSEPTIVELMRALIAERTDKVSLVRKPVGLTPAAILVLCMGEKSIKAIGGGVLTFVKQHQLGDPWRLADIQFEKSTSIIFDVMTGARRSSFRHFQWCYGTFHIQMEGLQRAAGLQPAVPNQQSAIGNRQSRVALFAMAGTERCLQLAAELTQRGLPTSLS